MRVRETSLWQWLKNGTRFAKRLHMRRIENGVGSGDPDVEGCWDGVVFNTELKVGEVDSKGIVKAKFQPLQRPWLKKRWECGGYSWLLIQIKSDRYLIKGCDVGVIFNKDFDKSDYSITNFDELTSASLVLPGTRAIEVLNKMTGRP